MILAIDIGNTTTSCGVFEGRKLTSQFAIATSRAKRGNEIARRIKTLMVKRKLNVAHADDVLVSSVVPMMTQMVVAALRRIGARRPKVVGQDIVVPLVNRYTYPEQVGQDRLVGAYAAWCAYGAPRGRPAGRHPERAAGRRARDAAGRDVIVCDFGTAITIDVVTKKGEYLGGVIAPGLEISLEALATRTALLPKVELKEPPELLGRDTANSIRAGLIYGCAALCDGIVAQFKARYARDAAVVATGGASAFIAKHAKTLQHLRPHLVLEGLSALASLPK